MKWLVLFFILASNIWNFGRMIWTPSEKEIPHTQIRYYSLYDDSNPYYNKIQIAWLATDLSPMDEALL